MAGMVQHAQAESDRVTHGRTVAQWSTIDVAGPQLLVRRLTGWLWRIPLRSRAYGQENVPDEGGFILCPNHVSWLDGFVHVERQHRTMRVMGKSEVFAMPILGRLWPRLGVFPVVRGGGDLAAREIARRLLERGEALLLYPEGTRKGHPSALGTPRSGAALLALQTGVPVIPVASWGFREWDQPRRLRIPRIVTVYGAPLHFERCAPTPEQVEQARTQIWDAVAELRDRARELHAGGT